MSQPDVLYILKTQSVNIRIRIKIVMKNVDSSVFGTFRVKPVR